MHEALCLQLFDESYNPLRWEFIRKNAYAQIGLYQKHFNSNLQYLWSVYYVLIIASINIAKTNSGRTEAQKVIKQYYALFRNTNFKWDQEMLYFLMTFVMIFVDDIF